MVTQVLIRDETTGGEITGEQVVEFLTEKTAAPVVVLVAVVIVVACRYREEVERQVKVMTAGIV